MITNLTASDLIAFENLIAQAFNDGKIRAPVHLYSGNEHQMLRVFEDIGEEDWICCSWRSHYQCLLKGVPAEILRSRIFAGGSIALNFPECRIVSSAIVGGIIPIALGLALGIQRSGGRNKVICFVGDMTARTGIFHECIEYAKNFKLPLSFVIEDDNRSVCTDTRAAWGEKSESSLPDSFMHYGAMIYHYRYTSRWPHAGAGQRVQF